MTNTSYAFSGLEYPHTLVTTGTSESGSVKPVPAQLAHTGTFVSTHWHVLIHGSTTYLLPKNSITDETFQGGKGSCCFTTARGRLQTVSGAMKCAFQQHTQAGSSISLSKFLVQNFETGPPHSVDQAGLEFRDLLPLPPSTPPCLRWVYILKHHYHMCTQTGRASAGGTEGPGPVPSPLERHRTRQVRKAGKSSVCSQRGSRSCCPLVETPSPPPGTDAKEKLYVCVKGTHPTHSLLWVTIPDFLSLLQMGYLWDRERNSGRRKRK